MARLYANENVPLPAVEALRALGHDVLTVSQTGKAEQSWPDEEVLDFAIAERRAVLTMNRKHFVRLHGARPTHGGIIVCTVDPDFDAIASRIHAAIEGGADMSGRLWRVNRPQS